MNFFQNANLKPDTSLTTQVSVQYHASSTYDLFIGDEFIESFRSAEYAYEAGAELTTKG